MPDFNSTVALNANAPAPLNPLQTALQVAQYRTANAQGQGLQQALQANQAQGRAITSNTDANGNVNWNGAVAALSQDPQGAYNVPAFMQAATAQKQAAQTLQKGAVGLTSDQIDLANKMNQTIYQRLSTLDPNDPNFSAKILQNGADLVNQYHADPAMVISHLQSIPQDPAGRAAWLQKGLASVSSTMDNLKSMTPAPSQVDTGGSLQYKDVNPLTNPGIIGTTTPKTLDPGTATSPTPVMIGGVPKNVTRSQFANMSQGGDGGQPPPLPTVPMDPSLPTSSGQPAPLPGGTMPGSSPSTPVAAVAPKTIGVASGLPAGAGAIADAAATRFGALQQAAQQAKPLMQTYDLANQAVQGAIAQGKGSSSIASAGGVVQTLLGAMNIKSTGDSVKDYQLATNYLNSAADQAASSLGLSGSDSRLAAAKAGQPDPTNMNLPALQESIAHAKGLQQALLDRQQATTNFLAQNGNNTSALPQFETKWNQAFDPDVSYLRSLPQDAQGAAVNKMTVPQIQKMRQSYQSMKALGAF